MLYDCPLIGWSFAGGGFTSDSKPRVEPVKRPLKNAIMQEDYGTYTGPLVKKTTVEKRNESTNRKQTQHLLLYYRLSGHHHRAPHRNGFECCRLTDACKLGNPPVLSRSAGMIRAVRVKRNDDKMDGSNGRPSLRKFNYAKTPPRAEQRQRVGKGSAVPPGVFRSARGSVMV